MSKLRHVIVPLQQRWTIRSARRRIGAFVDEAQAISMALEVAVVERMHGHLVEVLRQDADGRWRILSLDATGRSAVVLVVTS